tara:strand:- start:4606 stop:4737 length:132 start_codon:yes stop_codon:yes gene_type:complete
MEGEQVFEQLERWLMTHVPQVYIANVFVVSLDPLDAVDRREEH